MARLIQIALLCLVVWTSLCDGAFVETNQQSAPGLKSDAHLLDQLHFEVASVQSRTNVQAQSEAPVSGDVMEYELSAMGRTFRLQLTRNTELFADDYQELVMDAQGQVVSRKSKAEVQTDCYWHGTVLGDPDSQVVASTCQDEPASSSPSMMSASSSSSSSSEVELSAHITAFGERLYVEPAYRLEASSSSLSAAASASHRKLLDYEGEGPPHVVYRMSDYEALMPKSDCGVDHDHAHTAESLSSFSSPPGRKLRAVVQQAHHASQMAMATAQFNQNSSAIQLMAGNPNKYVEVGIFHDKSRYDLMGAQTRSHGASVMNVVASMYRLAPSATSWSYNIFIRLKLQVVFATSDPYGTPTMIGAEAEPRSLLEKFSDWRQGRLTASALPDHDNGVLLSGYDFQDSTIGLAWLRTMCQPSRSSGISQVWNSNAAYAAKIVAHEMGHNFGMQHDNNQNYAGYPTMNSATLSSCASAPRIMSPSLSNDETQWSQCSQIYLEAFLNGAYANSMCLENIPSSEWTSAPVCGDGIREGDEECDCGPQGCSGIDQCCDAVTCKLLTTAQCAGYGYVTGSWSACSASCGPATQTRTVTCVVSGTTQPAYPDASCAGQTKPAASQSCNLPACVYTWDIGTYGACSLSCGGGTQTRTVQCKTGGSVVSSSLCSQPVPAASQSCNTQPCHTYAWSTGSFFACTASCGGGTQTRTVQCVRDGNTVVDDSFCAGSGSKPSTSQACNPQACPTYAWSTGNFLACSTTCGGGTQTRTVQCIRDGNTVVDDSFCASSGNKPSTSQACSTQACPTYAWSTGNFFACSTTCGGGSQTRTVQCVRDDTTVVDESYCAGSGNKPWTLQACNTQACPTYAWSTGNFLACSTACGGGTQTRTVQCVRDDTAVVDDSFCSGSMTKPVTWQACSTQACPSYAWSVSSYDPCDANCGGGMQTRSVQCLQDEVAAVEDEYCSAPKPGVSQSCNTQACPVYAWSTDSFGSCDAECGGGSQTRIVQCVRDHIEVVEDERCTGSKPATEQDCNTQPCYAWAVTSDWDDCTAQCQGGVQTRDVVCVNNDTQSVEDDTRCNPALAPPNQQECNTQACPVASASFWNQNAGSVPVYGVFIIVGLIVVIAACMVLWFCLRKIRPRAPGGGGDS